MRSVAPVARISASNATVSATLARMRVQRLLVDRPRPASAADSRCGRAGAANVAWKCAIVRGFRAEQRRRCRASSPGARAPINLPARLAPFVDHRDRQRRARRARPRPRCRPDRRRRSRPCITWQIPAARLVRTCMPSATAVVQARTRDAVGKPHPAILARAHQAEAGAHLVAELVPPQRVARRENRDQHAVAGVGRHLRAIDEDAHRRTVRHNRAHQSASHDCLTLRMTCAHACRTCGVVQSRI